jgi:hypothetical protein
VIRIGIGETFSRSWEITKQSFKIIKSDKEILIFPVLASIFSIIFFVFMALPFVMTGVLQQTGLDQLGQVAYYVVIFVFYLGVAFISTFFNVAVVYCAKKRFEGGDPTFGEGFKEAVKRIHLIFLWSLVSATVGLILRLLENSANNKKNNIFGRIIMSIIVGILGTAWSIVSVFVVPALVFDNVGPFKALKNSVSAIKKTWGESLIKHYGLGMAETLFVLLGLIILVPGIFLLSVIWQVGLILSGIFIIYLMVVFLLFGTANTIFNTALYMYAEKGATPKVYALETMKNAFVKK